MTLKSPLYRKKVECPVCRNYTENFVLKSKIFVPSKVDADSYVLSYDCIDKTYAICEPSFYALWICTTCGYSDLPEFFEIFLSAPTYEFEKLKNAVLRETGNKKGLLFNLLSHVHFTDTGFDFESVMNIHLLALYCNDTLFPTNPDFAKLGRLYLRTSWLYRDAKRIGYQDKPYDTFPSYAAYIESLRGMWPILPSSEKACLERAAHYYSKIIYQDFSYEEAVRKIKLICLAADIYVRSERFKEAYDLVHGVVRLGFELRDDIRRTLDERKTAKDLSEKDELFFRNRIEKISNQLSDVHDKYVAIKQQWVAQYKTVIAEVAITNQGNPSEVLIAELKARKVPQEVINIVAAQDPRFGGKEDDKKQFWKFWK